VAEMGAPRRYEGHGCAVTYDAKRCIHAAECVHGLPAVFDPRAKPWIKPAASEVGALAAVIRRCPTGALKLESADGAAEPVPPTNTATVTRDGPTYLRGDLEVIGADGAGAIIDTRMAVCRCGASQNKPFCDASHRSLGFRDPGIVRAGESPPDAHAGGRLTIRMRPNGPLMCTGPLLVVDPDGHAAYAESTFLCRCGGSENKPYCDGTHKKNGFVG
jgi:CDGSH-type Zn-finger protein/uncharacterized Fe-S cluster protein YjdI